MKRQFAELNLMALDIENAVSGIMIGYLNSNKEYPYDAINNLVDKYEVIFNKINKKKKSVINEFLNNLNSKRKASFADLNAPNKYEVLARASSKTVPHILNYFNQYIPVDEQSKRNISDKLFPIVKDMELTSITSLYSSFKSRMRDINIEGFDYDVASAYLQQIFVGYVIAKLSHNPLNKFSPRVGYSYEKVCKDILQEPVLDVEAKNNKRNM